ncbi:MAG TPA: SUF system Fe-S cluster assembly regulator [Rhodocyclaceae bacterium]|nr:SUF system Fe-S cluster assembly regulator [Rhodocyclaceae bacterium]
MLRLSKLTDYGTAIMAYMARRHGRVFTAAELAMGVGVALPTASKILKLLARGGLLRSMRGAKGGYALARPAGEISIAQIVVCMEGPIGLTECSVDGGGCAKEEACEVKSDWQRINRIICHALEQISLADMTQSAVS